jgi:hypothetical protein
MFTGENRPMREKQSRNRSLMRLSEQSLEKVSVFKEAIRNILLFFLFKRAG